MTPREAGAALEPGWRSTMCPYCGVGCGLLVQVQDGRVARVTEVEMQLTWIFKPQMELLLRCAGFSRWAIYGGFAREPLVRDDQEMVVEAWG